MRGPTGSVKGPISVIPQQKTHAVKKSKIGFFNRIKTQITRSDKQLPHTDGVSNSAKKSLTSYKVGIQNKVILQLVKLQGSYTSTNKQLETLGFNHSEAKLLQRSLIKAYGSINKAKAASELLGNLHTQFTANMINNGVTSEQATALFKATVLSHAENPEIAGKQLDQLQTHQKKFHVTLTQSGFSEEHVQKLFQKAADVCHDDIARLPSVLTLIKNNQLGFAFKLKSALAEQGIKDNGATAKAILAKAGDDPAKIKAGIKEAEAQRFTSLKHQAVSVLMSYGLEKQDAFVLFDHIASQSNSLPKLDTTLNELYNRLYTNQLKDTAVEIFTNHGLFADDAMLMLDDVVKSAKGDVDVLEQNLNKMYGYLKDKLLSEASAYLRGEGGYSAEDASTLAETLFEVSGGVEAEVWFEIKDRIHGKQLSRDSVQYKQAADVLGVSEDADASTIRKAYFKLAKKYHPDKNGGDEAAAKMFKIVESAYGLLNKRPSS